MLTTLHDRSSMRVISECRISSLQVHIVQGNENVTRSFISTRRSRHHSATVPSLMGGESRVSRPCPGFGVPLTLLRTLYCSVSDGLLIFAPPLSLVLRLPTRWAHDACQVSSPLIALDSLHQSAASPPVLYAPGHTFIPRTNASHKVIKVV